MWNKKDIFKVLAALFETNLLHRCYFGPFCLGRFFFALWLSCFFHPAYSSFFSPTLLTLSVLSYCDPCPACVPCELVLPPSPLVSVLGRVPFKCSFTHIFARVLSLCLPSLNFFSNLPYHLTRFCLRSLRGVFPLALFLLPFSTPVQPNLGSRPPSLFFQCRLLPF